jgi:hypothetical protein
MNISNIKSSHYNKLYSYKKAICNHWEKILVPQSSMTVGNSTHNTKSKNVYSIQSAQYIKKLKLQLITAL